MLKNRGVSVWEKADGTEGKKGRKKSGTLPRIGKIAARHSSRSHLSRALKEEKAVFCPSTHCVDCGVRKGKPETTKVEKEKGRKGRP